MVARCPRGVAVMTYAQDFAALILICALTLWPLWM